MNAELPSPTAYFWHVKQTISALDSVSPSNLSSHDFTYFLLCLFLSYDCLLSFRFWPLSSRCDCPDSVGLEEAEAEVNANIDCCRCLDAMLFTVLWARLCYNRCDRLKRTNHMHHLIALCQSNVGWSIDWSAFATLVQYVYNWHAGTSQVNRHWPTSLHSSWTKS